MFSSESPSAPVTVYSTTWCPYCVMAKRLLDRKGAGYEEINIEEQPELAATMVERSGGRRTVPQIFIGGMHIGGYDELAALERSGELDGLLASPQS